MMKLHPLHLLLPLVLLLGSSLFFASTTNAQNCSSITEIACNVEGFEILCEAIEATGLGDDLDGEMWTFFAPNNEAFTALSMGAVEVLMDDVVGLTDLLLFHVVPGLVLSSDELDCDGFLEMANGDESQTLCDFDGDGDNTTTIFQVGDGNSNPASYPQVVTADIEACNGFIHEIDAVMLFENVTQVMPTDSPTETATTIAPTIAASDPPTIAETPAPTDAPVEASASPTDNEIEELTDSPTESVTTTAPTATPVAAVPTEAPVSLTTAPTVDDDGCQTITEEVCDNDDFSTLCALLIATGLGDVLDVESDTFTVFGPSNEAFAKLGDAAIDYLLQAEQSALLSEILLFHVIPESKLLSSDLECTELYEMANLEDSRTVCREPFIYQKGAGNSNEARPEIVAADLEVCNGVIHEVNEVMLYKTIAALGIPPPDATIAPVDTPTAAPNTESTTIPSPTSAPVVMVPTETTTPRPVGSCETLDEIICGEDQYAALCERLRKTGFNVALSEGTWTVFAPTNQAFVGLGRSALDALDGDIAELAGVLLFHLVPEQTLLKEDLPCVAGQNLIEMATGKDSRTLCMDDANGVPQPKYQKGAGNPDDVKPMFTEFDKIACNGVIHTIDGVLRHFPLPE